MRWAVVLLAPWSLLAAAVPLSWAESAPIDDVRVYLHYRRPADRPTVDAIADVLASMDYHVVDKRLVTQPTSGDVRFFHEPDRTAAMHVKAIVENVLAGRGHGVTLDVLDRRGRFKDASPGLVEVWVPAAPR